MRIKQDLKKNLTTCIIQALESLVRYSSVEFPVIISSGCMQIVSARLQYSGGKD